MLLTTESNPGLITHSPWEHAPPLQLLCRFPPSILPDDFIHTHNLNTFLYPSDHQKNVSSAPGSYQPIACFYSPKRQAVLDAVQESLRLDMYQKGLIAFSPEFAPSQGPVQWAAVWLLRLEILMLWFFYHNIWIRSLTISCPVPHCTLWTLPFCLCCHGLSLPHRISVVKHFFLSLSILSWTCSLSYIT